MNFAPIVWVEASIAGGKTTFCKEISSRLGYDFLEEPVETNFYLEPFYKDPKAHAFGMQILLLHHRYAMKQTASFSVMLGKSKGVLLDRSIAGDRVFAKLHHKAGNIDDLGWRCYNYAYEVMARTIQPPTMLIYLDVQPETAYARMKQRARGAEVGVSLDYLQALHDGYEELLAEMQRGLVPWSHSIMVHRLIWDRGTTTAEEWDAVAKTVRASVNRQLQVSAAQREA